MPRLRISWEAEEQEKHLLYGTDLFAGRCTLARHETGQPTRLARSLRSRPPSHSRSQTCKAQKLDQSQLLKTKNRTNTQTGQMAPDGYGYGLRLNVSQSL